MAQLRRLPAFLEHDFGHLIADTMPSGSLAAAVHEIFPVSATVGGVGDGTDTVAVGPDRVGQVARLSAEAQRRLGQMSGRQIVRFIGAVVLEIFVAMASGTPELLVELGSLVAPLVIALEMWWFLTRPRG